MTRTYMMGIDQILEAQTLAAAMGALEEKIKEWLDLDNVGLSNCLLPSKMR